MAAGILGFVAQIFGLWLTTWTVSEHITDVQPSWRQACLDYGPDSGEPS